MKNQELRLEFRVNDVRQWEVADAIGISEMTLVKWLRKELPEEKKQFLREGMKKVLESRNCMGV